MTIYNDHNNDNKIRNYGNIEDNLSFLLHHSKCNSRFFNKLFLKKTPFLLIKTTIIMH